MINMESYPPFRDYYNNEYSYIVSLNKTTNTLNIKYYNRENECKFSGSINEKTLDALPIKLSVKDLFENFKNAHEGFERNLKNHNIVYHTELKDSELLIKFVWNDNDNDIINENDKLYYEYTISLFNGIKMQDCTTIKVNKYIETSDNIYIHYILNKSCFNKRRIYNGRSDNFWYRMFQHRRDDSDMKILYITFGDAYMEDIIYRQNRLKYKNVMPVYGGSFTSETISNLDSITLNKMDKTILDKCFSCGEKGHYSASCPNKLSGKKRSREEYENAPVIAKIEEPSQCLKEPVPITKESDKKE